MSPLRRPVWLPLVTALVRVMSACAPVSVNSIGSNAVPRAAEGTVLPDWNLCCRAPCGFSACSALVSLLVSSVILFYAGLFSAVNMAAESRAFPYVKPECQLCHRGLVHILIACLVVLSCPPKNPWPPVTLLPQSIHLPQASLLKHFPSIRQFSH